jgi:Family of unknown function (DUF6675)
MRNTQNRTRQFGHPKRLITIMVLMITAVRGTQGVDSYLAASSVRFQTAGLASLNGPQPPCGDQPTPPYPDSVQTAVVKSWSESDVGSDWKPAACTGWNEIGFRRLVSISSRFLSTSTSSELLRRVGAISTLKGMRYWSTTHKQWRRVIVDAHALIGKTGGHRGDFAPAELKQGSVLYFEEVDNLSGAANYQMKILEASATRLSFKVENASTVRYHYLRVFHPGDLQSVYFMERESDTTWRCYGLVRMGRNASGVLAGSEASFVNRAVAFYRHFVGIPDDQEPPAAR